MKHRLILLSVLCVFASATTEAETYRWVDEKGVVHYTDTPPPSPAPPPPPPSTAQPTPSQRGPVSKLEARLDETGEVVKLSSDEAVALETVLAIALGQELHCKLATGKYCSSLEELVKKTGGEKNPNHDPNYQYRVTLRGSGWEAAATPRRSGLAGFFGAGEALYYNPGGRATNRDKKLNVSGALGEEGQVRIK